MLGAKNAGGVGSKDDARMKAKLAQSEERMARLRNAKARTIGLDVDALDAMVAEKALSKKAERDAEMAEAMRMRELQTLLLEREASIFEQQSMQNKQVADSWNQQARQRDEMKRKERAEKPRTIVPEETGKSGCQNFDGEDGAFEQRRRLQALQFRQWAQAQMSEKQTKATQEKEEDFRTAQYLKDVEEACKEMESSHLNKQYSTQMEMVNYNKRLAEEKRRKEKELKDAEQKANMAEIEGQLNDPYMKEDMALASSETGRMRTDNFKGMGQEAVQAMCEGNKRLAEEKNRLMQAEKDEDYAYAQHLKNITEQLSVQHYVQEESKRNEQVKQRDFLESQRGEQASKNALGRQAAQGEMGAQFFNNFGSSVR